MRINSLNDAAKYGPTHDQGDQIGDFGQLGYFWKLIMIIWKDEVAQRNGNILGYFLLRRIYYIFT